jgi:hypothetical protein
MVGAVGIEPTLSCHAVSRDGLLLLLPVGEEWLEHPTSAFNRGALSPELLPRKELTYCTSKQAVVYCFVIPVGFEPTTLRVRASCSGATELRDRSSFFSVGTLHVDVFLLRVSAHRSFCPHGRSGGSRTRASSVKSRVCKPANTSDR